MLRMGHLSEDRGASDSPSTETVIATAGPALPEPAHEFCRGVARSDAARASREGYSESSQKLLEDESYRACVEHDRREDWVP